MLVNYDLQSVIIIKLHSADASLPIPAVSTEHRTGGKDVFHCGFIPLNLHLSMRGSLPSTCLKSAGYRSIYICRKLYSTYIYQTSVRAGCSSPCALQLFQAGIAGRLCFSNYSRAQVDAESRSNTSTLPERSCRSGAQMFLLWRE